MLQQLEFGCKTVNVTCNNCGRIISTHGNLRDKLHELLWRRGRLRLFLFYRIHVYLDKLIWGDYGAAYYDFTKEMGIKLNQVDFGTQNYCGLCSKGGIQYRFFDSDGKLLTEWK